MVILAVQAYSAFGQANELAGSWKNGSVGMISYQNRVTGSTKPGRGSVFTYRFDPNGSYEYVGYMEVTMYNCTTTLFNNITGKYIVEGSTVHLSPSRDYWKNTNSCAASGNKETTKKPTRKTLRYERRRDENGSILLCISEPGTEGSCFNKES